MTGKYIANEPSGTPAEFYGHEGKMKGRKFSHKKSKRAHKRHGRRKGGR
jgi:hypothetical protein